MSIRKFVRRLIGLPPASSPRTDDPLFRSIVEQSSDVICHVEDGRFTYVSPSASRAFGWNPETMIGTEGFELIYEPDVPILQDVLARRATGREVGPTRHELRVVCGDGSLKWSETSAHSEMRPDGKTQAVLVIRDISERKQAEEHLEALAMTDGLTNLANRRAFDAMLERAWRQTLQEGSELALLLIDVDHFKELNDAYGHLTGDDCLRMIGAILNRCAQQAAALPCRYGGDEFAVIFGHAGAGSAIQVAEDIRSAIVALQIPHEANSGSPFLTVSLGVATAVARVGGSVRMPETLLQAADHALYKAKAAGRNRVEHSMVIAPSEQ